MKTSVILSELTRQPNEVGGSLFPASQRPEASCNDP